MGSYDDLGSGIRVRNGSICKSAVVGIMVMVFSLFWIAAASFVVYSVYNATYAQTITFNGDEQLLIIDSSSVYGLGATHEVYPTSWIREVVVSPSWNGDGKFQALASVILDNKSTDLTSEDLVPVLVGEPSSQQLAEQWKRLMESLLAGRYSEADDLLSPLSKKATRAVKVVSSPNVYRIERDSPTMVYIGSGLAFLFLPVGFALFLVGLLLIYQADVVEVLVDGKKERISIVRTSWKSVKESIIPFSAIDHLEVNPTDEVEFVVKLYYVDPAKKGQKGKDGKPKLSHIELLQSHTHAQAERLRLRMEELCGLESVGTGDD